MIIERFATQVKRVPHQVAIKTGEVTWTYEELNRYANRIAHQVLNSLPEVGKTADDQDYNVQVPARVALLFEHSPHMIAAILGVLKAGCAYVPLSVDYPDNRLAYMIADPGATLVLTTGQYLARAQDISDLPGIQTPGKTKVISIASDNEKKPLDTPDSTDPGITNPGERLAYIMYTSGSTGVPKGVMQTHENVLYYIDNWVRIFSITSSDRMTLFSSFCHDASIPDIFAALLSGATLYPVEVRERTSTTGLVPFLVKERITVWHSVASFFSYFTNNLDVASAGTGTIEFPFLRWILLGGEAIREHDIEMFQQYFPHSILGAIYGQTESTFNSSWLIEPKDRVEQLVIGKPVEGMEIFVIDEDDAEVDEYETGEIIIACPHISPGYWNKAGVTETSFSKDEDFGRLYFTGDLGRKLPGGAVEFMGRKDAQVKLRGFRIELGEIETLLLRYPGIKEAAVALKELRLSAQQDGPNHEVGNTEKYLCAYIVHRDTANTSNDTTNEETQLRQYLASSLPDYMIPSYFTFLDKLPLTQSGKIDRRALPYPQASSQGRYHPPRNPVEEKLAVIWQEVLGLGSEPVGIDDDFFRLGGHSLRGITMLSKVHREFDVQVPVGKIFELSTIRGLARYISEDAKKETFVPIHPAPTREYYPVSPIQERLFVVNQVEGNETAYNIRNVLQIEGKLVLTRLENAFHELIARHESLRTSFELRDDQAVQVIHPIVDIDFHVEYFDLMGPGVGFGSAPSATEAEENPAVKEIIAGFIHHFDLSQAPLLRVGLIKTGEDSHLLMTDIHHIISDGTSQMIFFRDFLALYNGAELAPLTLQYKDYSYWQMQQQESSLKNQEAYWLDIFADGVPVLENFTDHPRPPVQSFSGDLLRLTLDAGLTAGIRHLAREFGATLYMVLLAIYNILLNKYTGQEDIVIGTPVAGRNHPGLENIIGLFINVLVMRNHPGPGKSFNEFLTGVKQTTTAAFENRDVPFGTLLEKLGIIPDVSRNPIYDLELIVQNMEFPTLETKDIRFRPYPFGVETTQVDASLYVAESRENIHFRLIYDTALFKRKTMENFLIHFKEIAATVVADKDIKIRDITIEHHLQQVSSADVYSQMTGDGDLDF